MSFTAGAMVVGVVAGLLAGGRPGNVGRRRLAVVWLLAGSVALQAGAELAELPDRVGLVLVLVSYVGLSVFAVANIRLVGMPVVLVGLVCNLVVIALNGGMPVRGDAIVAAHAADTEELDRLDFGAKRHLEEPDDRVTFLGDVIPVRPTREVLSFGDLILAFGVADVVFRLLKPGPGGQRRSREDDSAVIDLTRPTAPGPVAQHLVDA